MRTYSADTLTELHRNLCQSIVLAREEELDVISSVDVQIHNTLSECDSMAWEFDMKDLWLTKSRWSMMVRQYIDPEELQSWIEKITAKIGLRGRGIALMRTKTVAARGGAATGHTNKETRRWGSCMVALSYKALPRPQITLYSRTSYLGYLSALDLSVAWMCAKYLAAELGCDVEDFAFVWVNEALQFHNFKSLAYLLNHPDEHWRKRYRKLILKTPIKPGGKIERQIDQFPALRLSRNWMQKMIKLDEEGHTLGDMSYNTYRRIRRRYHTEVLGYEEAQKFEGWSYYKKGPKEGEKKEYFKAYQPLPSTLVSTLDLSPIGMPFGKQWGVEFEGGDLDDEDDDE